MMEPLGTEPMSSGLVGSALDHRVTTAQFHQLTSGCYIFGQLKKRRPDLCSYGRGAKVSTLLQVGLSGGNKDMKPANILITRDGVLKLADFGLSQFYNENSRNQCLTNRVVTLWYRPPELLLGSKHYGPKIDMWGTGCIMAELWLKCALFQGNTEIQQLSVISNLCGSITPETLPEVKELPLYNKIRLVTGKKRQLKENLRFHIRDALALDLIDKLLQLDSQKRLNTEGAISHSFFSTAPNDGGLRELLSNIHVNMFDKDSQKRRAQEQLQRDPKRRCADLCESIVY